MSIELHCPQCTKLIRAPKGAGGKHGKCPYCGHSVYIPMPPEEVEVIPLAPIDEEEERRAEELRRESVLLAAKVSKATEDLSRLNETPSPQEKPGEVIDVAEEVKRFVLAMHRSELDKADTAVKRLSESRSRARDYVEGLLLDEIPPAFENVPPPLVQGFLKTLVDRLS